MKYIKSLLLICLPLLSIGQEKNNTFLFEKEWQFRKAGDTNWLPATVPGTVHTDLMANKKIGDPYYRNNEKDLQWIDKEDWEYRTSFVVDEKTIANDHVELLFDGLDTYADVYLNNTKILVADNMFRSWKKEVKKYLKTGSNDLRVYFYSPINKVLPVYDSLSYTVPVSNNDQAEKKLSVFTRKAGYHYGWDWGPRLVTSGIWRPVHLLAWSKAKLEDVFIKQKSLGPKVALLEAQLEISSTDEGIKTIELFAEGLGVPIVKNDVHLSKGTNQVNLPFSMKNPELWWPLGMGSQKLYRFKIVLKDGFQILSSKEVKRGLRNIEVVQESDIKGRSFYFKVNGRPVFMKGANYIPQDNFLPRVTKERYGHLINTAVESNTNMLRVWGGGIYENDIFYDLCDEKGILVWQDFMFACAMSPPFEDLKKNIYEEAVENVKRLRNHPSIAIWNGNNEIVQFVNSNFWNVVKDPWKNAKDSASLFNTYETIFHQILPAAVKAYDDEKFYWSSSPNGDNISLKFNQQVYKGDMHYWGVWGGKDKIENYNKVVPRFMSEYGFQSFPEMETIKKFAIPEDYNLNSKVMTSHQRSGKGNAGITDHMKDWFKTPKDFGKFLYVTQLLQAEAIKVAIEAHRRAMPYCMGSLYWQINDVWPGASWSSMDYFGRWKAQQYIVKKAYNHVLVSPIFENDSLRVYAISDNIQPDRVNLQIRLKDFSGKTLKEHIQTVDMPSNSSKVLFSVSEKEFLQGLDKKGVLLEAKLIKQTEELSTNNYYFEKPKDLTLVKPEISYTLSKTGKSYQLRLKTNSLARYVKISIGAENIILSDNYFDLVPGQDKIVTFQSGKTINKNNISVTSLFDTL